MIRIPNNEHESNSMALPFLTLIAKTATEKAATEEAATEEAATEEAAEGL